MLRQAQHKDLIPDMEVFGIFFGGKSCQVLKTSQYYLLIFIDLQKNPSLQI